MTGWPERWARSHRGRLAVLVALVTAMTGPLLAFVFQSTAGPNLCSGDVECPAPFPATLCFAPEVFVVSLIVNAVVIRRSERLHKDRTRDLWTLAFGFSYLAFLAIVVGLVVAPPTMLMTLCALWRFVV